jgi:hypothetical protein
MLLATASASQIADVSTKLIDEENFHNAVVNSANYATEIKDYKKAAEIMESEQLRQAKSDLTFSDLEMTKEEIGTMIQGFFEAMHIGDMIAVLEMKKCMISGSATAGVIANLIRVYTSYDRSAWYPGKLFAWIINTQEAFFAVIITAMFTFFMCRPQGVNIEPLRKVS